MPRTIKLLVPVLADETRLEAGSVVDATNSAADYLIDRDPPFAEPSDATERHPAINLLHTVTQVPAPEPKKKAVKATPAKDKS